MTGTWYILNKLLLFSHETGCMTHEIKLMRMVGLRWEKVVMKVLDIHANNTIIYLWKKIYDCQLCVRIVLDARVTTMNRNS